MAICPNTRLGALSFALLDAERHRIGTVPDGIPHKRVRQRGQHRIGECSAARVHAKHHDHEAVHRYGHEAAEQANVEIAIQCRGARHSELVELTGHAPAKFDVKRARRTLSVIPDHIERAGRRRGSGADRSTVYNIRGEITET